MKIGDLNWMGLTTYLKEEDRVVLPLGVVEQHAYLSLNTDSLVAEKIALEAAEPLGVAVLPVLAYGFTPDPFPAAYPGTLTFTHDTYARLLREILDSLFNHAFRRILIVNGHGGNNEIGKAVTEAWESERSDGQAIWHTWLWAPGTQGVLHEIDPESRYERRHASWVENFPWTRVGGVEYPDHPKEPIDLDAVLTATPEEARELVGDGCFGGLYIRSAAEENRLWDAAVSETRELLVSGWRASQ